MLPPPTPRCCHHCHHAVAALPNALLLPLKLRFRQAAASATKLATTTVLPPPPPLPLHCHRPTNTVYKKKKYIILLTNLFFTTMVTAARSDNNRNQSTCIEKGKPKNNNKIRFSLSNTFFCSNSCLCNCHHCPSWQLPATHAASPLPPPSSPQWRQWQLQFFTILQTSSDGCMQIISTSLRSSITSTSN